MPIFSVHKNIGETPLEALERVRKDNGIASDISMTYAGRLDPAAEGVLIVLSGDDVHRKDEYKDLPKVYEVDLLFGLSTDTGDLLGVLQSAQVRHVQKTDIATILQKLSGTREQKFHSFSSKPVDGIPLWSHAREKSNITIPSHRITIDAITILSEDTISFADIFAKVKSIAEKVSGDFRQKKIIDSWQSHAGELHDAQFQKITIEVTCGSGTYMRVLAEEIGNELNIPVLASRILRKSVGSFT